MRSRPPGRRSARPASGPARVGIYGGTFNPVHIAHLLLAEEVRERFRLDRVLFVPSGTPPHKRGNFPSGAERLGMVRLAVRGNESFGVLDLEVRRRGPSYTVETLRELRRRFPGGTEFFFLLGMDAFREITTWHEADALADLTSFVVFPRPGFPLEDPAPYFPSRWKPGRMVARGRGVRRAPAGRRHSIFLVETAAFPVSATEIRERVKAGRSIRYLVPEKVRTYIAARGLYTHRSRGG